MKKNYLLLMTMLLFAVVGFTSCSDDDEGGISGNAEELLVGDWTAIHFEGYYKYDGVIEEEWDEPIDGRGVYLFFYEDGTVEMDGAYADWRISGNTLILDGDRVTIETLNATTLVLSMRESYDGEEYFERITFERID